MHARVPETGGKGQERLTLPSNSTIFAPTFANADPLWRQARGLADATAQHRVPGGPLLCDNIWQPQAPLVGILLKQADGSRVGIEVGAGRNAA
jgi:hypothetical protein